MKKKAFADITWVNSGGSQLNAWRNLPFLSRRLFQSGDETLHDRSSEMLHSFRLLAKQVRYLLEFFQSCYDSRLREQIAEMKRLQNHLGAVSDCRTTARILQQERLSELPEASHFKRYLDRKAEEHTQAFIHYWMANLGREAVQTRWIDHLEGPEESNM